MSSPIASNCPSPGLSSIRIRPYEDRDESLVHKLYLQSNVEGEEGAPVSAALQVHLSSPSTFLNCGGFGLGLGLASVGYLGKHCCLSRPFRTPPALDNALPVRFAPVFSQLFQRVQKISPTWVSKISRRAACLGLGVLLSGVSLAHWLLYRSYIRQDFQEYGRISMESDLKDIGAYYMGFQRADGPGTEVGNCGLRKAGVASRRTDFFWVAEEETTGEILGFVGLDSKMNPGPNALELRRMVVSPKCRRRGLGHRLTRTIIDHVKGLNDPSSPNPNFTLIVLSTTAFQTIAIKMYESNGWKKTEVVEYGLKHKYLGEFSGYKLRVQKMVLELKGDHGAQE